LVGFRQARCFMSTTNSYCQALDIEPPRLEAVRNSAEANYYSLLIVALLERGVPLSLEQVAKRFEAAGIAPAGRALASLKRCKPARPPVYRDGDVYALDPYDDEVDLWAFRLGLRPARVIAAPVARPTPGPLPSIDEPLSVAALDEAWRRGIPSGWSALRIATCVLDAEGRAMRAEDVVAFVQSRTPWCPLSVDSAEHWRAGPVYVGATRVWELEPEHEAVRAARQAVRERIAMVRRWDRMQPDVGAIQANEERLERERDERAERLAHMRRVIVRTFPAEAPFAAALLDVERRTITTIVGTELEGVKSRLDEYDIVAGANIRAVLRALAFDPGERRLAELGPPQKTVTLNRWGRTLRITTGLLVQGSCGISRPFGDDDALRGYVQGGHESKLRRRLEADAKSLFALYQYGRLHGRVRVRWGFLDEMFPAPWVHRDERTLYDLLRQAHRFGAALDVVAGSAPGWTDPWGRVRRARVVEDDPSWRLCLVDEHGYRIALGDVQLARIAGAAVAEAQEPRPAVEKGPGTCEQGDAGGVSPILSPFLPA
jgi:hypothetical protein